MKYRTDLAIERAEILQEEGCNVISINGINMKKISYSEGVSAIRIAVTDHEGERQIGKPMGNYITIETEGLLEGREGIKDAAEHAVCEELKRLIPFHYKLKVLVAGLGNKQVTPDSLGPAVAEKIRVTRHLFMLYDADGDDEMSNVSCLVPGVTASTGMETADIVKKAAELSSPEYIIVIDSLAARNIERVSTTIQITDTGIDPGAGMGNHRTGINEETTGVKVIAIGVPTVIDSATIIRDALAENMDKVQDINEYMDRYDQQMIVTSTDIDMIIKDFSDIIANGINKALHPGIYS